MKRGIEAACEGDGFIRWQRFGEVVALAEVAFEGLQGAEFALILDASFTIPLWAHACIWTFAALGLTLGLLRPLKAYIIALQFKHRPGDWK